MHVLFREPKNPNTATPTLYLTRDTANNSLVSTTSRKRALEFDTAREAYQFAADNGDLDNWRVGER